MDDLRFSTLEAANTPAFKTMTFPVYRHLLDLQPSTRHPEQADRRAIQPVAVGAFCGGRAVGLALAEHPLVADQQPPELLSLFVESDVRRQGVASGLLRALEQELTARGCAEVQAVYTTGRAGSLAVEQLFQQRGWGEPQTRTVLVQLDPTEFLASELLSATRLEAYDPGFEIFPWHELPVDERAALQTSDTERRWVTPGLAAWKFDTEPYDQATSIGARYRGQVVGWVIAQRIHPTAVRYLASFMRKDLSRRGRILPLFKASLERAAADGCDLATFVTPVIYPTMIRFIHRWMAPHARLVAETRGVTRRLAAFS